MNLKITSRHFSASNKLKILVFEKIKKIEKFNNNVKNCHIILIKENNNENVEIILHLRGHDFISSADDKNFESSLTIIAEKGTIKIGGQYMDKLEYCNIKNYDRPKFLDSNSDKNNSSYKGSSQNHYYIYENVIDFLNNNIEIKTNALDGMKVTEIIEKIYEAGNLK